MQSPNPGKNQPFSAQIVGGSKAVCGERWQMEWEVRGIHYTGLFTHPEVSKDAVALLDIVAVC